VAGFLEMAIEQEQRTKPDDPSTKQRAWHKRDKLVDFAAEEKETRAKVIELVAALVAPGFDEAIALLEKVIKRRKERFEDDYPEGQVNLGLFYGAVRRFEDAVNHLTLYAEPAVTRAASSDNAQATEWLRDAWLFAGRWLTNLSAATDLLLAVNKLDRAYKLNYDDPAVGFYFSQALRNVVRLQLLPAARTNLAWYLLAGAPLGFEDDARQFVAASDEKGSVR
jgi:tetratricopeptide (TPR) repeat protein